MTRESWLDQIKSKAPILIGVMVAWVISGLLVGWFFVKPRVTHTTVTGTVVMPHFVSPALLEQMAADIPGADPSMLIPTCHDNGSIRNGSGRIVAAPVGKQVQTGRTDDGSVFTLECTTTYKASVPRDDVYRISTVLGEMSPDQPGDQAEATVQRSDLKDGQLPTLRMTDTVPDLS